MLFNAPRIPCVMITTNSLTLNRVTDSRMKTLQNHIVIPGKSSAAQGHCLFPCSVPLTRSLKQPWLVKQRPSEGLELAPWASVPFRTKTMTWCLFCFFRSAAHIRVFCLDTQKGLDTHYLNTSNT